MAKEITEAPNEQATGSLKDFTTNDNWFGIKDESNKDEKVLEEVKTDKVVTDDDDKDDKSDTKKTKGKAKAEVIDDEDDEDGEEVATFFGEKDDKDKKVKKGEEEEETPEEEEEEEDKDKKKDKSKKKEEDEPKEEDEDKFYNTLASEMKEKGIFQNVEVKEGEILTEEQFFELQDKEIEARVEESLQTFFEEMDDDGKEFLKHKKNGGKTSDFLAVYASGFDLTEFDETNADHISKTLNHYLQAYEKLEGEDLKDRLEWLKEGGKEKTYATKYFNKIQDDLKEQKEELKVAVDKAAKKRDEDEKKFNKELTETLSKTENVGIFNITKEDQKELGNYITKPTVKVGKNRYVPEFQAKLAKVFKAETPEDRQKLLLLAKLFKNDFDTTDFKTETKTKVVKEVKSKLKEAKAGVKTSSSGNNSKKSLADSFD